MKDIMMIWFCIMLFLGCGQPDNERRQQPTVQRPDSLELTTLVRELYKWRETESSVQDFGPKSSPIQDSVYTGLDMISHAKRLQELRNTSFFSEEFISQYDTVGQIIDNDIRNRSLTWYIGEEPPFGNGSDHWCDCQDCPEKYWETMTIRNIEHHQDYTSFNWAWGKDHSYHVDARKENGVWKILYLQGFGREHMINYLTGASD